MGFKLVIFVLSLVLSISSVFLLDSCSIHTTCGACIRHSHISCKWCTLDNFNGTRCKPAGETADECKDSFINPKNRITVHVDRNFSSESGKVTQIKPQQYNMALRPGIPSTFKFEFKGAKDYPADLYFLLDASMTMLPMKAAIADAGESIYREFTKMTKNVFMGFGTFIDKNALPFVEQVNSTQTYSFRNNLKLTRDFQKFKDVIVNAPFGSNFDVPEGGLDALAQVITCKREIGWREQSRKIVVFFTDSSYHAAGDGKLAGIVQPYDGKCYTENGLYTKELEMDYPSLSIIRKLAAEEEVTIVFTIEVKSSMPYKKLINQIRGSTCMTYTKIEKKENSKLSDVIFDDGQLENTLSKIYEDISQTIKLKISMATEHRKFVEISFSPDCSNPKNGNCTIRNFNKLQIDANITLLQYYGKDQIPIEIQIEGIKERLFLKIDVIKNCGCETDAKQMELNSTYCNSGGTKKCGICECNLNRHGDRCACTETNRKLDEDAGCKAPGSEATCSSRGFCSCGTCKCQPGFEGQYCECSKDSCPLKCSRNGDCVCGKCICWPGWSGELCQCAHATCTADMKCSNRGKCECGACKCDEIAQWDAREMINGNDCSVLPCHNCHDRQCAILEPCALCLHRNSTSCTSVCDQRNILNITESFNDNYTDPILHGNYENVFTCHDVNVEFACYTSFKYKYDDGKYTITLYAETKKNCVEYVEYYILGGVFLGTLLLAGFVTLVVWKLLTEARDRREYEQFEKQQKTDASGVCHNIAYEPPNTTFRNVAYRKPSIS